ncbi:hypothetical protein KP509_13G093000 [Ceratopteris richardii]|uniref:U-box domain-containing protein n=1 Tax=Ceratopteris richardii TaxID=49495 RepID=A0A8T2TL88_CERRI|nr:hypothetical protein KP509_13G093000 [Ceratopteris richardii]
MEENNLALQPIVSKLGSTSSQQQKEGVCELRLLAKLNDRNRIAIAKLDAIPLLLKLVYSSDDKIQENAVTALLNLSVSNVNRTAVMRSATRFLDAASYALTQGHTMETKANCAALLFSIMVREDYRPIIGRNERIVVPLLKLLQDGSHRGQRDALRALFHIALCAESRPFLVSNGAISALVTLLRRPKCSVAEDCLAVLAQLALCTASVEAFQNTFSIPLVLRILNEGVSMAQENAASVLLNLCKSGGTPVIKMLPSGSCITSLSVLLSSGSSRAKSKASALMQILVTEVAFEDTDLSSPGYLYE